MIKNGSRMPLEASITPAQAQAMDDEALTKAIETNIYEAGYYRMHSVEDANCTVLYAEATRRGKVILYTVGYNRACGRAGVSQAAA